MIVFVSQISARFCGFFHERASKMRVGFGAVRGAFG